MRADRLLAILMRLQSRGRLTAQELARELEVSERTIYRDIDALSVAGVPVYGEPGPGGGFALLDTYRTNLTGLTQGEVRALSMLRIPAPLVELGLSEELRAALLKLSASLPDARRLDEERVRKRFHLDSTWWQQGTEQVPHLQTIHRAVWENQKLFITYKPPFTVEVEQKVAPYGLVAKAGIWYLVYERRGGIRALRVSNFLDVRVSEESFEHPDDFNLTTFWKGWCEDRERFFATYTATVRIAPELVPHLPRYFGSQIHDQITQADPPDRDGWIHLELSFESLVAARTQALGFGRGMEVLEPLALRRSVLDFAEQIVSLYSS